MDVYDFDNTIYDGESVVDFLLLCLKKEKSLVRYAPTVIYGFIFYKLGILTIDRLIEKYSKMTRVFVKHSGKLDGIVTEFWEKNEKKLKPIYLKRLTSDTVVTTLCPEFIIERIHPILNVKDIICSEFDVKTGQFIFANMGKNKVVSFKKKYPNGVIKNFYTDSYIDSPLMELSENVYLVKGNEEPRLIKRNGIKLNRRGS